MKTYEFSLVLSGVTELTDELCDRLFAAGCDDGSPFSRDGVTRIPFDRAAPSLEEAIRSAIANVQAAGYKVERLEIEADAELMKV